MRRVGNNFEPIDGEALLNELKNQNSEPENKTVSNEKAEVVILKSTPKPAAIEARRRQSIMDNPKVPFIFNAVDGTVHDKDCPLAKKIPGKCFRAAYKLPRDKEKICPSCFKMAMVRLMVGNNRKHISAYCKFFERIGFGKGTLYQLAVRNKTSLLEISKDQIKLKTNEDKWILIINNDKIELWHNNYYVCEDNSRILYDTYHKQAVYKKNSPLECKVLSDIILNYSWHKHIELIKAEKAHKKLLEQLKIQWKTRINYQIIKRGFFKTKITYIDIGEKSMSLFNEADIKVYQTRTKKDDLSHIYPVCFCKVKHKDLPIFKRIMNELKQMSMCEEYQEYVSYCFEKNNSI